MCRFFFSAPNIVLGFRLLTLIPLRASQTWTRSALGRNLSINQTLAFSRWGRGHVLPLPHPGSEGFDFSLTFTVLLVKVIRTLLQIDTQPVGPGGKQPAKPAASIVISAVWTRRFSVNIRGTRWNLESVCPESIVKNRAIYAETSSFHFTVIKARVTAGRKWNQHGKKGSDRRRTTRKELRCRVETCSPINVHFILPPPAVSPATWLEFITVFCVHLLCLWATLPPLVSGGTATFAPYQLAFRACCITLHCYVL